MNGADLYGCYCFNNEWYLIEMVVNVAPSKIDWSGFVVPEAGVKESDWQCPYMEQYLNEEGTEKLCDTYDVPKEEMDSCRIAFFIYRTAAGCLHTPYGDFELSGGSEVPPRLKDIIEFE